MLAERSQTAVQHPMMTRIRACSTTPDAAASFFTAILHPKPSARLTSLQALQHPYLRQCVHQMQDHYHQPPIDPPRNMEERMSCETLPEAASRRNMLRSLGTAGRAAGFVGFAVVKSVAKAVSGKRRHDMSQYFPAYTHPQHDSDLLHHKSEDDATAVARDSATSNHSTCQGTGASLVAAYVVGTEGQLSASTQQVLARQQRSAAAVDAADRQRPKPMAKPQVRGPVLKSRKVNRQCLPFDPMQRVKAPVRVDPQHTLASINPGSTVSSAHAKRVPEAAVLIADRSDIAVAAVNAEAPAATASVSAKAHSTTDVSALTAVENRRVPATAATATAAATRDCFVTRQSLQSHRIELLPEDDEDCDLGTAQQRLQSHPIQLFPEDEEDCQMVDQLQGQQNHSPVSVTDGGEGRDSDPHRQPSRLQCHAVSSLNSCIDMDSHMADTSNTQQVSVATAGSHNADGATHGLALHVGSIYGLPTSDRWRQDRGDDAHSEAGSTTPASPDEELYAARYIETTVADRLVCWDNSTRLQK